MTDIEAKIITLRRRAASYDSIAAELGLSKAAIAQRCRRLGYGGKLADEARIPLAIEKAKQLEGYEYLGGYSGSDGWLVLRCKKCGCEFNASCVTIRKDETVVCPGCRAAQKEVRKTLEEIGRQVKGEAALIDKMLEQLAKDCGEDLQEFNDCAKIHLCADCGKYIYGRRQRCEKCSRKRTNRLHEHMRRAKIKCALVDKDIDLMALYHRDNGVCHICGGLCDLDDYWLDEDGAFIAGDGYPSIDHVLPLSKGGLHCWENVKLAHRYCNTLKSDKVISPHSALAQ